MPKVTAEQSTIRTRVERIRRERYKDFEDYETAEVDRLRQEARTDAAERLRLPMNGGFEYELTEDGIVLMQTIETATGTRTERISIREIFEQGVEDAQEQVAWRPDWEFELVRRQLELEELDAIEALARGERAQAQALIVISPHPDAIREGYAEDFPGYDKKRRKTMIRITARTERGVFVTSMSLDQSNTAAIQAAIEALGYTPPEDTSSENILAQHYWMYEQPPDGYDWSDVMRRAYDLSLAEQLGGEWYAGQPYTTDRPETMQESLAFVDAHPDLLEQYVTEIRFLRKRISNEQDRSKGYDELLYNYIAALDARLRGEEVTSIADAGESARGAGLAYDPECPQLGSAEEQLASQGFGAAKRNKTGEVACQCPFCKQMVVVDPCASRIKCPACAVEVIDGRVIYPKEKELHRELGEQALAAAKVIAEAQPVKGSKIGTVKRLPDGRYAVYREEISVGGSTRRWVDQETGKGITLPGAAQAA